MKTITLKQLSLLNFKGVRNLTIDFNDTVTTISGRNGSGKTTVMDAFTWLLFGKDSQDRKQFNIKTLDESGIAIPDIPHEVGAILTVDGKEISLRRRYTEIWRRHRGEIEAKFVGHEEERLYNDVPCNVGEWAEKINAIVSEENFKFITNPLYFPTRKTEDQRRKLFEMAGRMSNQEIAAGNPKFEKLLAMLNGKTMDEFKREIAAKKKRLKEEVEGNPYRIDECKRSMPADENWEQLGKDIEAKQKELDDINKQSDDIIEAYRQDNEKNKNKADEINSIEKKKQERISKIKSDCTNDYYKNVQKKNEHDASIRSKEGEINILKSERKKHEDLLETYKKRREELLNEWKGVNAEQLQFKEDEFICPTCKRQLEVDEIEKKQEELESNFNQNKARRLEENKRKGLANKASIDAIEADIKSTDEKIAKLEQELAELKKVTFGEIIMPDATPLIDNDAEVKAFDAQIAQLKTELNNDIQQPDTSELQTRRNEISNEISDLRIRLAKKKDIADCNDRIADLEKQTLKLNGEITELEGIEMTMIEFSKARATLIESRVNDMFHLVKFKMFETLVNGQEIETCVATVDGVPWNDGLNNAGKIHAGLDIISALQRHMQVSAPVVIDNAEAVNVFPAMQNQMILLKVSEDKCLTIK